MCFARLYIWGCAAERRGRGEREEKEGYGESLNTEEKERGRVKRKGGGEE